MESDVKDLEILDIQSDKIEKKEYLGNRNLKKIMIPPFVKTIEAWGFAYCKGLECIWIPKTISSIEGNAFDGCESLKEIVIYEMKEMDNGDSIQNVSFENVFCYKKEASLLAYGICNFPDNLEKNFLKVNNINR